MPTELDFAPVGRHMLTPPDQHTSHIRHKSAPDRDSNPDRGPDHQGRDSFPMDTSQNTALMRALTELPGPLPARGVIHIAIRHTDRFTVVGNHLAQHPTLSTTAVGLAVRIQSLPQGTEIGIKALAARFPEGEKLVAAALRELEAHGYLQRARTRLPNGRIVTRTVFCNQPAALLRPRAVAPLPQRRPAAPQIPAPQIPEPEPPAPEPPAPEAAAAPAPPDVQHDHEDEHAPQANTPFVPLVPPPPRPSRRACPCLNPANSPRSWTAPPPHSSATSAATHPSSCSPRTTSASSSPQSRPGWNATPTPTPSATPSPTTRPGSSATPPNSSGTGSPCCCPRPSPAPTNSPPPPDHGSSSPRYRPATAANAPSAPPPPAAAATAEPNTGPPRPPPDDRPGRAPSW
ncbi:protein of unknown function [Streptomyces sp. KY75]|nr:protein of unknown function [Streptomyces sp. KY75]